MTEDSSSWTTIKTRDDIALYESHIVAFISNIYVFGGGERGSKLWSPSVDLSGDRIMFGYVRKAVWGGNPELATVLLSSAVHCARSLDIKYIEEQRKNGNNKATGLDSYIRMRDATLEEKMAIDAAVNIGEAVIEYANRGFQAALFNETFDEKIRMSPGSPMISASGTKRWYLNGSLHREDGPAVEFPNGTKEWWRNGDWHREDGPAIEYADGTKLWYIKGLLHRENGPAVEKADSTKEWRRNGELHREDGPAIERADGTKYWYIKGRLHRDGAPAVEEADGTKEWWCNGELHCEDGPAIEWADGTTQWAFHGRRLPLEESAPLQLEWSVKNSAGPLQKSVPIPKFLRLRF